MRKEGSIKLYILAAVALAILAAIPFSGNTYFMSILIIVAIFTISAVGLCLLMGYTGQVSLGHAAFYGIGAFMSAILSVTYGVSPWLAMLAGIIVSAVIAYLTGRPIFRLKGNYLAMATLGFGIIVNILFVQLDQFTGGPSGIPGVPSLAIGPLAFDSDFKFYYLAWAFCIAILLLSQNIVRSRFGRALRSIHGNEEAARSLGVNVSQFKVKVFMLSAVYASIAGSLFAHYTTFVSPQPFGFMTSVQMVLMVVVGGMGSIWGAIFGAGAITLLSNVLQQFGELETIVFGAILIIVMVFMPQGLVKGAVQLWQHLSQRQARVEEEYEVNWPESSQSEA
jgi:branched-chain amino acid transport system permease protein